MNACVNIVCLVFQHLLLLAEFSLLEVVEVLAILEFRFVHFAVGFSNRAIFLHKTANIQCWFLALLKCKGVAVLV